MTYKDKRKLSHKLFEILAIPLYALELCVFGLYWMADEIAMQIRGRKK